MFNRLSTYAVYIHPEKPNALEQARFVPEGFSWVAFVLSVVLLAPLWTLYHRLWLLTAFIILFFVGLGYLQVEAWLDEMSGFILHIGFSLWVGFGAYDWYGTVLRQRGYALSGVVMAPNLVGAQQRFFDHYFRGEEESSLSEHASDSMVSMPST